MQSNPYHNQPEIESSSTGPWRSGCGCTPATLTGIIVLFLVPAIQRNFGTREAARRTQCKSHLKHIVIALHNYHDVYGGFPPAFTVDADGKPLHSWRTLILPFIEQQALYDQIDLSVPWDHPTNAAMHETNIATYQCPSAGLAAGYTTYRAIVGDDKGLHPTDRRPISEFNDGDGPEQCVLIVETSAVDAVRWMDPGDIGNELFVAADEGSDTVHANGLQVGFADGTCRFLSAGMSARARKGLMTIRGNEDLEDLSDF